MNWKSVFILYFGINGLWLHLVNILNSLSKTVTALDFSAPLGFQIIRFLSFKWKFLFND